MPMSSLPLRPVILALPEARRPGTTVCAMCPAAMWHVLPNSLRCYCRKMHHETFTSEEPEQRILLCGGLLESHAALEEDTSWDASEPSFD